MTSKSHEAIEELKYFC